MIQHLSVTWPFTSTSPYLLALVIARLPVGLVR